MSYNKDVLEPAVDAIAKACLDFLVPQLKDLADEVNAPQRVSFEWSHKLTPELPESGADPEDLPIAMKRRIHYSFVVDSGAISCLIAQEDDMYPDVFYLPSGGDFSRFVSYNRPIAEDLVADWDMVLANLMKDMLRLKNKFKRIKHFKAVHNPRKMDAIKNDDKEEDA